MKNPFNLAEKGEFFECGFLKDTQIFVADSMVKDTETKKYKGSKSPPGYRREDLICGVEIVNKPYHDKPDDNEELGRKYFEHYRKFCKQAKATEIDDNPAVALSKVITERSGDEETQKVELEYKEKTYCHHRAMREIWRDFEASEKVKLLPCLSEVHPLYSTSFGIYQPLYPPTKDLATLKSLFSQGDLISQELGLPLQGSDKDAITLNTIYLKFDNNEWGMCGFVDLTNKKIHEENRFRFSKLNAAFTSGPKDKFEHCQIHGVDFELRTMVEWIRGNHDKPASSAKIVFVKVLQAFFGVADVIDAFERKMS